MTPGTAQTTPSDQPRPLRQDAERNRRRILTAAREVFSDRGLSVTLDEIARHAGVGVGTVYRRFPGKEALIDALFEEKVSSLLSLSEKALANPDPWEGFVDLFTAASEQMVRDRGLREVMLFSTYGRDRVARLRQRLLPIATQLVSRARDAGQLRPDVAPTDIPLLELMLGAAGQYTYQVQPDLWHRYLDILLDGLRARPEGNSQLSQPPLDAAQLEAVMRSTAG
ncbi:TetR/AcrR family transcriptional regulator [Streptomyces sp. NPDC085932]|uniref:TetR/AcrR family transcriptional regulator n=1 Tax=Streptomyces sp. NPDC085932 TaxID=3365741 RepID=UPI0037D78526